MTQEDYSKEQEDYIKSLQIFNEVNERCRLTKGFEYFDVNAEIAAFHKQQEDYFGETLVFKKDNIEDIIFTLNWQSSSVNLSSDLSLYELTNKYGDILQWGLNKYDMYLYITCDDYEGFYDEIDFDE